MVTLAQRLDAFLLATGLPITRLCKKIELTPQSFYCWRNGSLNLKPETLQRIDKFLTQFNY